MNNFSTPTRRINTNKQVTSTPRYHRSNPVLNACYTPSSLYRNACRTPTATTSASKYDAHTTKESYSTEASNLTVAVRIRPLNERENAIPIIKDVIQVENNEIFITVGTSSSASAEVTHSFAYDKVYCSREPNTREYASQATVFQYTAQPLLDWAFEGYNACLFAYGQTGSGKSYSMIGYEAQESNAIDSKGLHTEAGIVPRFCHELFGRLECLKQTLHAEIEISYFEIYNEKIYDLLRSLNSDETNIENITTNAATQTPVQRAALKVREHPLWGPYVEGLSAHPIDSYKSFQNWLAVGNSYRATAATGMNDKSSRSHCILNIMLTMTDLTDTSKDKRQTRRSKISLVDLAGSERIDASNSSNERIREGVSINKSLLTLGRVIAALSDGPKGSTGSVFVPYRESILTWLLRENLGGNSKTAMLATISPASVHIDETLATLRYACQARRIINRVRVNESPHDKIIRELRAEIDRLKSLQTEYSRRRSITNQNPTPTNAKISGYVSEKEVNLLRQQLVEREKELNRVQTSWMERLKEAEQQQRMEIRALKQKGLALELPAAEVKQACLVNLSADPILSGTIFYILPLGKVRIGRSSAANAVQSNLDIILDGPLVAYSHCTIDNKNGHLCITQEAANFETFLNGELLQKPTQLFHGDRLVIGGMHYFRVSNPFCKRYNSREKSQVVDFHLAHKEILQKQEEKLRCELEKEKAEALSRLELERMENERNFKERLQELELEQLKFKCNHEILESERKALHKEVTANQSLSSVRTHSYQSRIFEEINSILQNPSEQSLHNTQLMVKEATQRCRDLGLILEFRQAQKMDEFGIFRTVILLIDKKLEMKAEWPTARLSVWLDMMRDIDGLTKDNIFDSVDVTWEPLSNADVNIDKSMSPNSSGISLNLSIVKDGAFRVTPKGKRNESENKFITQANALIGDLQSSALRLKNVCAKEREGKENSLHNNVNAKNIYECVGKIENVIKEMRVCLARGNMEVIGANSLTPKSVRFYDH